MEDYTGKIVGGVIALIVASILGLFRTVFTNSKAIEGVKSEVRKEVALVNQKLDLQHKNTMSRMEHIYQSLKGNT